MGLRQAKLVNKKFLTNDVFELTFETDEIFEYKAGQFITIKITDNPLSPCVRGYSISSRPKQENKIFELCVKLMPTGRGSNYLKNLVEGDTIQFIGPSGKFTFADHPEEKAILISTGTGISPIKAMIEDELINKNYKGKIELLFGVRYISGVFYNDIFKALAEKYGNFSYITTISRPEKEDYKGPKGRVTDLLRPLKVDPLSTNFYMCGLKDMIDEVTQILREKQVPEERIHFEKYD